MQLYSCFSNIIIYARICMGDEMKHKHLDQDSRTLSHELECSLLKLDSVQQEKKKFRLKTASVFKL